VRKERAQRAVVSRTTRPRGYERRVAISHQELDYKQKETIISKTMTATQAQDHFGDVMRQVIEDGEPVIVEQSGKPQVAVISMTDLQRLRESQANEQQPEPNGQRVDWWADFERELGEQPIEL